MMKLCWIKKFFLKKYHKKYIFKHYLKFSIGNSKNPPWGSKRYALNTVAKLFKGSLAHWSSHKTGSWAPNAGSCLVFLLPALHWESSLGGLYRGFPKIDTFSKLMSLPLMMEEICSLGFSWLLPSQRAWAYWKQSWKCPRSSRILSNRIIAGS